MLKVEVGKNYFYNNGLVKILKIETDNFVLVEGNGNLHTEIDGSSFCAACNIGGTNGAPLTHSCDSAQEIIDIVIEDMSDLNIFWVNIKHLQEKPFEYQKWEKITQENNILLSEIKKLKEEKETLKGNIQSLKEETEVLENSIQKLKENYEKIINDLNAAEKRKIVLENIPEIKITNSNLIIKTDVLLSLIKDSLILGALEAGGVDNWEWHSESICNNIPDSCKDTEEYYKNLAIEELSSYVKH
jgi:hypothetical protein